MNSMMAGTNYWVPGILGLALCACSPISQMQPLIPNGGRAVAVAVHPTNANRIIVASETGGLFRSTDGGVNWKHVSSTTTFGYTDVLYLPTHPEVVLATARSDMRIPTGGGIWRSTNGGASWSKAAITPPTTDCTDNLAAFGLAFEVAAGRLWAGTLCGLAFSDDEGANWQFLPPSSVSEKVYAVLAPAANQLKILTDGGVKVSPNGGGSWTLSTTGLPSHILKGVHNQIGVSPFDPSHVYWAFDYWSWNAATSAWEGRRALYRSVDNGSSWSSLRDVAARVNRPPFVRVAQGALAETPNAYDIYYGDGACTFERATITHGATPTISPWTSLTVDHCDPADLGFATDNRTPLLLATDGGLHLTADNGLHWTFTGAHGHGYGALQITEVTGQVHSGGAPAELYFGTQDNHIWASADEGAAWTAHRCCEGFYLNVWRDPLPTADTKFTGVSCGACGNFISGPVLAGQTGFPNPPNNNGNPRLLKPGAYLQNTEITGVPGNVFDLTENNGGLWTPRYGFPEPVRDLSKVAGASTDPTIFTAVKTSGVTPDGQEMLGIKRVIGVLGGGTPMVFDVTGFGSLGIFPTMFAWYKPFGVAPNANYLIVPDVLDEVVKVSKDGGGTWQPDNVLTQLVTESGSLRFRTRSFTQITTFAFDPVCIGHIVVGTRQAGIFQTFDWGHKWERIDGSPAIPNVSTFFFPRKGRVIASSYGRGLWKIKYRCPPPLLLPPTSFVQLEEPLIYWMGAYVPISQLKNPDACPVCTFFLVEHGRILGYVIDSASDRIAKVQVSGGQARAYAWGGQEVAVPFQTDSVTQPIGFGSDQDLLALLSRQKLQVKGLVLARGTLRALILGSDDVAVSQLPQRRPRGPTITADVPQMGVPAGQLRQLVLRGRGFEPGLPIEIRLDGRAVRLEGEQRAVADSLGGFTVSIPPFVDVGGHTIIVRQRTSHGVLEDAYTFNVTVQDSQPEQR